MVWYLYYLFFVWFEIKILKNLMKEIINKSKKVSATQHAYLGLCMASRGFGAEIIYSLNLGFWSSTSFFSPEDFTSGFTGSGGFSLLWGPFVQPWREKDSLLGSRFWAISLTSSPQTWMSAHSDRRSNTDMTAAACHQGRQQNPTLTTMLRKSEKSVVLLLQQDHPWKIPKDTFIRSDSRT